MPLDKPSSPRDMDPRGGEPLPLMADLIKTDCNTGDAVLYANAASAIARQIPVVAQVPEHDGVALIVGGAPSLNETWREIAVRQQGGQTIFALNGAGHWLKNHGIIPDWVVILDARPFNLRFVQGHDPKTKFLLASQCDPSLFDAVPDAVMWHQNYEGKSGIWEGRPHVQIGGGTTVGMRSIRLCFELGYRVIHLFGLDSCYRADDCHAYAQPENDGESVAPFVIGDREFLCTGWMARQVEDFVQIALDLAEHDTVIATHGDGAIQHAAHLISQPPVKDGVLTAVYDLGSAPASYDFTVWLVHAKLMQRRLGAEKLRVCFAPGPNGGFRHDDLPDTLPMREKLFNSVVRPALDLIGAEDGGFGREGIALPYTCAALSEAARAGETIPGYRPTPESLEWLRAWRNAALGDDGPYITVTLREAPTWPQRNSNLAAWLEAAVYLRASGERVVFVRETEKAGEDIPGWPTCHEAAVDLHKRCALYHEARLNLMVSNGPVGLVKFSDDVPFIEFGTAREGYHPGSAEFWDQHMGVKLGEQFPWMSPRQRMVMGADDVRTIITEYERIRPLLG